jgi:hypothetical protein
MDKKRQMTPALPSDRRAVPRSAPGPVSQSSLLEVDPASFRANFNRRAFTINHHLSNHPLFSLPQLTELSRRLPKEFIQYNSGEVSVDTGLYKGPSTGLSIEETIRRIEQCKSWMVIKFIENDPPYRALLDQCLDEVAVLSEPLAPGMRMREGFIFISSPLSTTPYHMDPEYNFLLQIRGTKELHVFDGSDRSILSERELEEFFASGSATNVTYNESIARKSEAFSGCGLHIPVTAPHWVQNGNEVSISFSITFQTRVSAYRNIVYTANSKLRKWGIDPAPYGRSPWRDSMKWYGYRALRRARSLFHTRQAPTPTADHG